MYSSLYVQAILLGLSQYNLTMDNIIELLPHPHILWALIDELRMNTSWEPRI